MEIRLSGTVNDSIVDGPGIRLTIFVQGCPHHCEGCHNPQTHDFNGGVIVNTDELLQKIKQNPLLSGVTFSGGEPFCQARQLAYLGKKIKDLNLDLDIVTYTGFLLEYLLDNANDENGYRELIDVSDYIVDGKFEEDKKSYLLKFKGSSNQRIIDVRKTLESGKVVETEF
jgi:anaerobic ribonucleoside-triphosphate reductase activating protein